MDYYKILGVRKSDDAKTIQKRFRELSLVYHPDKGGDLKKYQEISEAYGILSNKDKRRKYDETLRIGKEPKAKTNTYKDVFFEIYIGLADAVFGCTKTVEYNKSFVDIEIPSGVSDGERIVYKDYNRSGINVAATVHIIPDGGYSFEHYRNKRVLVYNLKIDRKSIGSFVDVRLLDGVKSIKIPEGVSNGRMLKVKNMGYPKNGMRGDLFIRLCVK